MFLLTPSTINSAMKKSQPINKLQHIVLIQFKDTTPLEQISEIKAQAMTLNKIKEVNQLKMSENVSPENLSQGYTHSLTMWFEKESYRDDIYFPHPVHKAFVDLFFPFTEKILVFDYWE